MKSVKALVGVGIAAGVIGSAACYDGPTAPQLHPSRDVVLSPGASYIEGCGTVRVSISGSSALVTSSDSTSCSQLAVIPDSGAQYVPDSSLVRIPVRVMNRSGTTVVAPANLFGWNDSITVIAPSDSARVRGGQYVGADTTLQDAAAPGAGVAKWQMDSALAPTGTGTGLPNGARSQVRWISVALNAWTQTVDLHLTVRVSDPTGAASPPNSIPEDVYTDSNVVSNSPDLGGKMLKNVVTVIFAPNASPDARAAAIASVGGTVIGGVRFSGADGAYLVRVASDSLGRGAVAAADSLNTRGDVAAASPEILTDASAGLDYLRPSVTSQ